MESSRPGTSRYRVAPIVFGVVAAVVAVWVVVVSTSDRDPEDTVEAFLTAVTEKDVEGALALVTRFGRGVPYGDGAAFLVPEAISDDWWVVSVTETSRKYGTAQVTAVIAGPGGTAEGEFVVEEDHEEWLLSDPFVSVRFPGSPLSYIRVNDKVVPWPRDAHGAASYQLFPGTYRFYEPVPGIVDSPGTEVVAAFPSEDGTVVVPPPLTVGADALAAAQEAVERHIDECVTFATPAPYGNCPFATDGEIDTPDGRRVSEVHGLTWKVAGYPKVALADNRTLRDSSGFTLSATEPGTVTLHGSGEDTDGAPATFTVTCDIDLTSLLATVGADGEVTLTASPSGAYRPDGAFDTCRRNA